MYDRCRSTGCGADPDEAPASEIPDEVPPDARRLAEAYRAEAARWEHIALQMSLIPDREYLLSLACELRAKAAAQEASCAAAADTGPGP